jgi:hypothetical protein
MKDVIAKIIIGVLVFCAIAGFIYGSYWVAKTVSYSFFYEDMVADTVREMVKPESLIKP